jgi:hypothetical protein
MKAIRFMPQDFQPINSTIGESFGNSPSIRIG